MSEPVTLRNPTVSDVVAALGRFAPEAPFLSAASVFTEVGFETGHDPDGRPFVIMSVLGRPTATFLAPPT